MGIETWRLEGQRCLCGHQESCSCWDGIRNMQRELLPELKKESLGGAGKVQAIRVLHLFRPSLAEARQKEKSLLLAIFSASTN